MESTLVPLLLKKMLTFPFGNTTLDGVKTESSDLGSNKIAQAEAYFGTCQISVMLLFVKLVNR